MHHRQCLPGCSSSGKGIGVCAEAVTACSALHSAPGLAQERELPMPCLRSGALYRSGHWAAHLPLLMSQFSLILLLCDGSHIGPMASNAPLRRISHVREIEWPICLPPLVAVTAHMESAQAATCQQQCLPFPQLAHHCVTAEGSIAVAAADQVDLQLLGRQLSAPGAAAGHSTLSRRECWSGC